MLERGGFIDGLMPRAGFGAEVAAVAETLVPMTLALWNKVQAKLLPTPAKFHYLFNMRELSKVRTPTSVSSQHVSRTMLLDAGLLTYNDISGPAAAVHVLTDGLTHGIEDPASEACTGHPARLSCRSFKECFLRPEIAWARKLEPLGRRRRMLAASLRPPATCWLCGAMSVSACSATSWCRLRTKPGLPAPFWSSHSAHRITACRQGECDP